ncbi:AAA family ATPase [Klebsiella quasipneumoniae]|uniref:AAA family ATPase n=1 Tax=Klebsiella quasipneumoniae TaxID=1463165 RepID=UPI00344C0594
MIQYIRIQNFRSVRDIELELGPLNIVFGPNGCGKSNIYNAIHLLTAAADGRLSGFIQRRGRPGKYDVVRRSFPPRSPSPPAANRLSDGEL